MSDQVPKINQEHPWPLVRSQESREAVTQASAELRDERAGEATEIHRLQAEVDRWKALAKGAADAAFDYYSAWYGETDSSGAPASRGEVPAVKAVDDALAGKP